MVTIYSLSIPFKPSLLRAECRFSPKRPNIAPHLYVFLTDSQKARSYVLLDKATCQGYHLAVGCLLGDRLPIF